MGTAAMAKDKFMVAACQILCGEEKEGNIAKAEQAVKNAAAAGAQVRLCLLAHRVAGESRQQ